MFTRSFKIKIVYIIDKMIHKSNNTKDLLLSNNIMLYIKW